MARRSRPDWGKVTMTLQLATARRVRISAAELGCEMGTFVDGVLCKHYQVMGAPATSPVAVRQPSEASILPHAEVAQAFADCEGDRFRIAMLLYQEALAATAGSPIQPLAFLGNREREFFAEVSECTVLMVLAATLEAIPASGFSRWNEQAARQFNIALQEVDALFELLGEAILPVGEILQALPVVEMVGMLLGEELITLIERATDSSLEAAANVMSDIQGFWNTEPTMFRDEGTMRSALDWVSLLQQFRTAQHAVPEEDGSSLDEGF